LPRICEALGSFPAGERERGKERRGEEKRGEKHMLANFIY
jgi:hypothetical protein